MPAAADDDGVGLLCNIANQNLKVECTNNGTLIKVKNFYISN